MTAPIVTDVVYTSPDLSFEVDENCTLYGLHNASATPLIFAAIKAGAEVTQALAAGIGYVEHDDAAWGAGTWYLHYGVEDVAGNSAVLTPIEHVIAAPGFTEIWDWLAVGNGWTEGSARYTRSGTAATFSIVADATAPDGKALRSGTTDINNHYIRNTEIAAALALRTTERIQWLTKRRFVSTGTSQIGGMGEIASGLFTGERVSRFGANQNNIYTQCAAAINTTTNRTTLLSNLTDLACYWVRVEIDGTALKGRAWLDGDSEPGSWTTYTHGSAIGLTTFGPVSYHSNPNQDVLGFSLAIGADAPGF